MSPRLVLAATLMASACGSTEPSGRDAPQHATHPVVGTYSVTTTLRTMTFLADCPLPPGPRCLSTVAVDGKATLYGSIVIGDSAVSGTGRVVLPVVTATLSGATCGTPGADSTCISSSILPTMFFHTVPESPSAIEGASLTRLFVEGSLPAGSTSVYFEGAYGGELIVGTVNWNVTPKQFYSGEFVARRQ